MAQGFHIKLIFQIDLLLVLQVLPLYSSSFSTPSPFLDQIYLLQCILDSLLEVSFNIYSEERFTDGIAASVSLTLDTVLHVYILSCRI